MSIGAGRSGDPGKRNAADNGKRVDLLFARTRGVPKALIEAWLPVLSESERIRYRRYILPTARDQFVLGRALLRSGLAAMHGMPAGSWRFASDARERPIVVEPASCRQATFNLSHTNGIVACAIAQGRGVGVDVEWLDRPIDHARMTVGLFAPSEIAHVAAAQGRQQIRRFYALWTLKEAYVKGRSRGLTIPFNSFWFDRSSTPIGLACASECPPEEGLPWQFHEFALTRAHQAALAVQAAVGEAVEIRLRRVDIGPPEPDPAAVADFGAAMRPTDSAADRILAAGPAQAQRQAGPFF